MVLEGTAVLVRDLPTAKAILGQINWSFYPPAPSAHGRVVPFDCRSHHWFPATFIPQIPYTLVEVLTQPGATVFDPFAGIGTTYVQALLLGRRPLATEVCTVAVNFLRSLLVLLDPDADLEKVDAYLDGTLAAFDPRQDYTPMVPANVAMELLGSWYSDMTLNQLSFLANEWQRCKEPLSRATMWISLSAMLRSVSGQDRGWGCVADNVTPKPYQLREKDALRAFRSRAGSLLRDVVAHVQALPPEYRGSYARAVAGDTILHQDIRTCKGIPDGCVDLVVTSPPYPNMTDYVTAQRLSYYVLGVDLASDLSCEIGARRKRFRRNSLNAYLSEMQAAGEVISAKVRPGGYVCYVMPVFDTDTRNNADRKRIVQLFMARLENAGLVKEGEFDRVIPAKRRSHNSKWTTLAREKIHLYRKA